MNPTRHHRLDRLDDLAAALSLTSGVVAVLGLGSAGVDRARFDDHSDIDVFVVVDDVGARHRLLADLGWLRAMGTVTYAFAHDPNGRKVLFDDGLFVECAVLTTTELAGLPFAGARIVWCRGDRDVALGGLAIPPATSLDTVAFHLNEALTNLFVGLHRELRGERLTATRFIQVYAVDRVLALHRLTRGATTVGDPFDATRRVETAHPELVGPLRAMLRGYDDNADAARGVLAWLRQGFDPDPAITGPIGVLIADVDALGVSPAATS